MASRFFVKISHESNSFLTELDDWLVTNAYDYRWVYDNPDVDLEIAFTQPRTAASLVAAIPGAERVTAVGQTGPSASSPPYLLYLHANEEPRLGDSSSGEDIEDSLGLSESEGSDYWEHDSDVEFRLVHPDDEDHPDLLGGQVDLMRDEETNWW